MKDQMQIVGDCPDQTGTIFLLNDGYVRLMLGTLLNTQLVHLVSALDEGISVPAYEGASATRISGYTEWISDATPTITLGWDWWLDVSQGKSGYARTGAPRSNVMLVDAAQCDFGPAKNLMLLDTVIDALAWKSEVHRQISTLYT